MGGKRKTLSQSTSRAKPKVSRISSSQPNINESFKNMTLTNSALRDLVNDCVRYMICKSGQQLPFRKTDLQKYIKSASGRTLDKVLENASTIMEKVYGYKVISCSDNSKFYIISNILPIYIEGPDEDDPNKLPKDSKKILLMLILVHLFMSPTAVTEASLYSFLKSFQIDPERKHEIFGNVKEYLTVTLIKQHYVRIEKDTITQATSYTWGERAEKEISKHDILKFVCKVFKDTVPQSWLTKFKEAERQPLENHRNEQPEREEENENE